MTTNWIFYIRGTDFQNQMSTHKFKVFIRIDINSLSFLKVLDDTIEMNNMISLINKNIWNFTLNNFIE